MINFMLDTGVRVSELCHMKISDIDFDNMQALVVNGKGGKDRYVYFTEKTLIRLNEYFKDREDIQITPIGGISYPIDTFLFASFRDNYHMITKSTVESVLREVGSLSGVERLHPHLLRATFATTLAENDVPLNVIAELLGHANLHTIDRYVLLSKKKIRQLLDNIN